MVHARSYKGFVAFILALLMLSACAETAEHRGTGQTFDDAAITARVKAAFARSPDVDAIDINVDTYKGDVTLHGYADDRHQIASAGNLARDVEGVHSVRNELRLKSETGRNN